ncbi:hypothetical protein BJ165DRAFT_1358900 [Panaeolus papilionaceus]|nr:hypothetical protein BJ165DRAFT_1358900 [Panaeolus papilionaceus]
MDQRTCADCLNDAGPQQGIWRCTECFDPQTLCRSCMRNRHMSNPFHRIECWMGDHFRPAALWEVGVFVAISHHNEETRGQCKTRQSLINVNLNSCSMTPIGSTSIKVTLRPGQPNNRIQNHEATLKRVVHINGIHHLEVFHCNCGGNSGMIEDSVAVGLMPSSFITPKTFFTTHLLDFARLCNLELKCSMYQFDQLLRRMTSPLSPATVKSLYHEFRRMCRLWRWLKKIRGSGTAHDGLMGNPGGGKFAMFCAACPQPSINLPKSWGQDAQNPIYRRTFVADGNFKADHVKQTGEDVPLYDRSGIMPESDTYWKHIDSAPCDNTFRAIETALNSAKGCDVTGVVAIACARHGCYCPNGMVDLQRGEQQKNVDYAFVKSLKSTHVDLRQRVTILYDVACQYFVKLRGRIDPMLASGDPDLQALVIDRAIGLFHVHAHKDQCFFRYSPTFIPGLGTVAGEILESLWAALNDISISLRTASLSYRSETLDDHATDSNHKKILNMAESLIDKLRDARENANEHQAVFDDIDQRARDQDLTREWEIKIEEAEARRLERPEVMDIYGADMTKISNASSRGETTPVGGDTGSPDDAVVTYLKAAIELEERQ